MEIKNGQIPPSLAASTSCTTGKPGKILPTVAQPKAVVKASNVIIKKDSAIKRFAKMFFADNVSDIKGHIVKNVLIPSLKNGISEIITSAVNMALYGQKGKPGSTSWGPSWLKTGFNYSAMYNSSSKPTEAPKQLVNVTELDNLLYKDYDTAYRVYVGLCSYISQYNCATVHNLYSLSGQVCTESVADNWGWYQLDWYSIDIVSYGGEQYYKLSLPPAISLPKR